MPNRAAALLLGAAVALAAVIGCALPSFSTAAFTSSTTSTARITSAPDWTPPTVSMVAPASPIRDTVTLTANAGDGETGVRDVTIELLPAGGSAWVTVCLSATAPYSCSWNSRNVADGHYDFRARAADRAGYATTSESVRATVANNVLVVLTSPGEVVSGTTVLSATVYNAALLTTSVRVEYAPAGTTTWKSVCTSLVAPHTCSWVTSSYANGEYDLRAVAVSGINTYTSAVVADVLVDNASPTVAMTDPGTPLLGMRTFAATASDAHSGVAQVVIQYAPTGSSTWKVLCTAVTMPYSCRYDTSAIPDGTYGFRAVATDVAGNNSTSVAVTNRVVDNTVSAVSVEDPGAYLTGTATLTASASSTAGVASVRIQYAAGGTSTWTDVCTDSTAPYACAWDTRAVVDGTYDLRAILLDGTGRTTTSTVSSGHRVDNTPLRGADVQSTNGGVAVGRIEAGDSITFTYTEQLNLGTVTTGWSGAAQAVSVRVRDGNLMALGNKGDTLDVLRNGVAVNLGSVNLREDYVRSSKSMLFNATMTAGTATVNGVVRTSVTIRLGALASGSGAKTVSLTSGMVWSPSSAATGLSGKPCSAAPTTEVGTLDRDF